MKKIICALLAIILILSIPIPAYAVTPPLDTPASPTVPDISGSVHVELPEDYWADYFEEHPIDITPTEETTEPPEEPETHYTNWHDWLRGWYRWWSNLTR